MSESRCTLREVIKHLKEEADWGMSRQDRFSPRESYEGIKYACEYLENTLSDETLDSPIVAKRKVNICFECARYTDNHGCVRRGGTKYLCNPQDLACIKFKKAVE